MIALDLHLDVYTINSCAVHGYPLIYLEGRSRTNWDCLASCMTVSEYLNPIWYEYALLWQFHNRPPRNWLSDRISTWIHQVDGYWTMSKKWLNFDIHGRKICNVNLGDSYMYTQINTTQIFTIRIGQYPKLSTDGNMTHNRAKICQFSSQTYRITGTCTSIRSFLKRAPKNVPWCLKNLAYQLLGTISQQTP